MAAVSRTLTRGVARSLAQRSSLTPIAVAAASRSFSTSLAARSSASAAEDLQRIQKQEIKKDPLGHATTGKSASLHTRRTLASLSLENKVCVVTGATRGLGNLIARTYIESGASKLAILDLDVAQAQAAADEATQWFVENGQAQPGELDITGWGCNVADEENVKDVMRKVRERYGSVDVVVNSAGIVENFPAEDYPTDKMNKLFQININGSYFVAREAAKIMLEDNTKGSIILIASMSASIVNVPQTQAPYNISKAAVKHMAASLAVEWAKRGIRVNSLSPGYMATALTKQIFELSPGGKELKAKWESLTPMGRMGDPEDLKGAAVYLGSDASKFTTGADLIVDGGYSNV